jgi:hypothetical protein
MPRATRQGWVGAIQVPKLIFIFIFLIFFYIHHNNVLLMAIMTSVIAECLLLLASSLSFNIREVFQPQSMDIISVEILMCIVASFA